nr:protease inhibitor carrapatin-like [Drosophila virilis]
MARFIALFLVLLMAVTVMAQMPDSMSFDSGARKMQFDKLSKVICYTKPEYGLCKGRRQMWYFNKYKLKCEKFIYSNCGGNRNRYFTKAECDEFCTDRAKEWIAKEMPMRPRHDIK